MELNIVILMAVSLGLAQIIRRPATAPRDVPKPAGYIAVHYHLIA
jgi:hypothetical protein